MALKERPSSALLDFMIHPVTLRVLTAGLVFLAWEWGGNVPISPSFPSFTETMRAMWELVVDGSMLRAYTITLQPLLLGILISGLLGITIGVAMALNAKAEWFGEPVFVIMQAAPLAALVPLITLAYGIGLTAKVLVVCIISMPVIVLNAYSAVRHTPVSLTEMGRSYLAPGYKIIFRIILPAASPVIFAGLRLGCAAGFIGVILAELLITPTGIGDIITYNRSIAEYPKMYAAIFSILVFAVLFIDLVERAEIILFRPDKRGQS